MCTVDLSLLPTRNNQGYDSIASVLTLSLEVFLLSVRQASAEHPHSTPHLRTAGTWGSRKSEQIKSLGPSTCNLLKIPLTFRIVITVAVNKLPQDTWRQGRKTTRLPDSNPPWLPPSSATVTAQMLLLPLPSLPLPPGRASLSLLDIDQHHCRAHCPSLPTAQCSAVPQTHGSQTLPGILFTRAGSCLQLQHHNILQPGVWPPISSKHEQILSSL